MMEKISKIPQQRVTLQQFQQQKQSESMGRIQKLPINSQTKQQKNIILNSPNNNNNLNAKNELTQSQNYQSNNNNNIQFFSTSNYFYQTKSIQPSKTDLFNQNGKPTINLLSNNPNNNLLASNNLNNINEMQQLENNSYLMVQNKSINNQSESLDINKNNSQRGAQSQHQQTKPISHQRLYSQKTEPIDYKFNSNNQANQSSNFYKTAANFTNNQFKDSIVNNNNTREKSPKVVLRFNYNEDEKKEQMFLIKDKDTGQTYDIRNIDQIDKFQKTNNQELLDKLKRRSKNAWASWWNSKKQNNLKMIQSVKENDFNTIDQLLQQERADLRADVDFKDNDQWAAIHYASENGNNTIVNLLISNNADVNIINNLEQTPLIVASIKNNYQTIDILLKAGADINKVDYLQQSALHYVCRGNYLESARLLLSNKNIDIYGKNKEGKTAIEYVSLQDIFDLFAQKVNQQSNNSKGELNKATSNISSQGSSFNSSNLILQEGTISQVIIHEYPNESVLKMFKNQQNQVPQQNISQQQQQQQQQQPQLNNNIIPNQQPFQQLQSQQIGPENFRIIDQIGRGSFGEVYLVEQKGGPDAYYAMKILHKSKIFGNNLIKYALTERNVLSIINHPFIIKLMFAFQTSKNLFLIMEYAPGGDLNNLIQREKRLSEQRARIYLCEIMLAIRHLHINDIVYRDLKPENVVIDAEGHAMLTDFGLSKDGIFDHYSTNSFCGSLAYLAPEMLKRSGHGKAVDYYHLGVLLYEMITGTPPFYSESRDEICYNIEFQEIKFPNYVSESARNLISRLLVKNPTKRLGYGKNDFEEMKKHPFFTGIIWNQVLQRKLKPPLPYLRQINTSKLNHTPDFMQQTKNMDNHINGWSFINFDGNIPNNMQQQQF